MSEDRSIRFGDAFKKFLKEENLDRKFKEKELISRWGEIMGSPISTRTKRLFFKDKTLFVELSSAPLKQELTNQREKVLNLIEEKLGKGLVDAIRFI